VIRKISDFTHRWSQENESTQKALNTLTDTSLAQPVTGDHRTLGRIAWHLTGTIKEMMEKTGLHIEGPDENAPVPTSARAIADTYARSAKSLLDAVQKEWTDATLEKTDEMYGEKWARGETLMILILHQTHHRGQMNVLMRQAGLQVTGIYGPAREEWAQWQMQPPTV
jgi:uncharacterized damage-inducible protein DinB